MMVDITTDKTPGWYNGAITVNITFPPNGRKAIITRDDVAPVLSEIIAYDKDPNTQAPRPFLAVTQDGRGNVVYDGGFPKYYNTNVSGSPVPTTFAQLNGSCKFFHNALKFCANPTKVAAGNNKVLVIGNTMNGENFNSKYSMRNNVGPTNFQATGMYDSWTPAATIAGFALTYMNADDFSGNIVDLPFSLLDQYCMVVYMASFPIYDQSSRHTPRTPTEVATYRAAGNGVFIITDHCGDVYTSVADAVARRSVFASDAILMAAPYGAYFSGNYDRTPVLVGDIRAENGDHPLFANIANDEYIIGAVSESIVFVDEHVADEVNPNVVQTYTLSDAGVYRINALIQMNDGSIITRPFRYDLIDPSNLLLRDIRGRILTETTTTVKRAYDLNVLYNIANPPTLIGKIRRNGLIQGTFTLVNNVYDNVMLGGKSFPVNSGDVITLDIELPFIYTLRTVITTDPLLASLAPIWTSPAAVGTTLMKAPDYSGQGRKQALQDYWSFARSYFRDAPNTSNLYGYWPRVLPDIKRSIAGVIGSASAWVSANATAWASTKPANPTIGTTAIVADSNLVKAWLTVDGVAQWVDVGDARTVLGLQRVVYATQNNARWLITSSGTIPY